MADLKIEQLGVQLEDLANVVSNNRNEALLKINKNADDISVINTELDKQANEDSELHEEIHKVANQIELDEFRINNLEVEDTAINNKITNINNDIGDLTNEDLELHEEIHTVANKVDRNSVLLNKITTLLNDGNGLQYKVIEESEYDAIGDNYEQDVFYFTYEEDEPVTPTPSEKATYENNVLTVDASYDNNVLTIVGVYENNTLTL